MLLSVLLLGAPTSLPTPRPQTPERSEVPVVVLDAGYHHLGDDDTPEWSEAPRTPEGLSFELRFPARPNDGEALLHLRLRHVDDPWIVSLNGHEVGRLERRRGDMPYEQLLPLPAGSLKSGENLLTIGGASKTDDFTFGDVRLILGSLREWLDLRRITVLVNDADTGAPLPARITVVDEANERVEIHGPLEVAGEPDRAVRRGVVYTAGGRASFEVPAGRLRVFATRGMEWSLGEAELDLTAAANGSTADATTVSLALRHEVDTTGWIAADTHVHTLTFSGHGDSSVEERMVTLAGEGVELAISTDHNHNTNYRPYQERMLLTEHFTPVVGNEVTTSNGHFNAFPLDPEDEVPAYDLEDWVELVDGMRAKGAQVVILNHPRWPDHDTGPFGVFGLDRLSGRRTTGYPFTFDAMELVNSTTEEEDATFLLRDWFALLCRGEPIFAVGSSDSHTVGDPVGQGRTYVRSSTDDPARIDVDEACAAFRTGRISVSQGIFCDVTVAGGFGQGDLALIGPVGPADPVGQTLAVEVVVRAPSWIRPEELVVWLDGEAAVRLPIPALGEGDPTDVVMPIDLPLPPADRFLVCTVTGPGVEGEYWPTLNPYTFAATNPVFLDVDGDGAWSSPRERAARLLLRVGVEPEPLAAALAEATRPVRAQAIELAWAEYLRRAEESLRRAAAGDAELDAFIDELDD